MPRVRRAQEPPSKLLGGGKELRFGARIEPSLRHEARELMRSEPRCAARFARLAGTRQAYVDGVEDIITAPVLTMEEEFRRDVSWKDHKGVEYSLAREWEYVTH